MFRSRSFKTLSLTNPAPNPGAYSYLKNAFLAPFSHRGTCVFLIVASAVLVLSLTGTRAAHSAQCLCSTHGSASEVAAEANAVTVTTYREGDATHFYVENKEFSEITMTFEMALVGMKG